MEKKGKYISGLDGLRAIAVAMVLAYHLKLPFVKCGLLGVTVFFVLSGFLIARILIMELEEKGRIHMKRFWTRRIRRLLPAVLTMTVVVIFVTAVVNRVLFTKGASDLLSSLLGYNNWWQIFREVSYFENAGLPSPFTHCWSLAVEWQFYLIYPLILLLLARSENRGKVFFAVTGGLAVISVILMAVLYNPGTDPSRVYYGTDTRAFSLLIGALAAIQLEYGVIRKRIGRKVWPIIGSAALVILVIMMLRVPSYSSFLYYGGQLITSILTVLVVYAVTISNSALNGILSLNVMKWIGDRSYSIYLWHYPIILMISGGKKAAWWVVLIEILVSLICMELSYQLVETPIRKGIIGEYISIIRRKPQSQRERRKQMRVIQNAKKIMAAATAIGMALILCILFVPKKTNLDAVAKREAEAEALKEVTQQKLEVQQEQQEEEKEETTELTDEELLSSLNILLIGDSINVNVASYYYEVLPNSISDTQIGRSTLTGCDVYDYYINNGIWDGDGVIFALGTNGPMYDTLGRMREKAGEKPLFLTTIHAPQQDYEAANNQEIRDFVNANEHTYLIDWNAISQGHGEYFDQDDMHLLPAGCEAYANGIKESVLSAFRQEEENKKKEAADSKKETTDSQDSKKNTNNSKKKSDSV